MAPPPYFERYRIAVGAIAMAPSNPEDTMLVALTHEELAVYVLGAILVRRLFPEVEGAGHRAIEKLYEINEATQFTARLADDDTP